jgi:ribosome biogenesis protein MAK21
LTRQTKEKSEKHLVNMVVVDAASSNKKRRRGRGGGDTKFDGGGKKNDGESSKAKITDKVKHHRSGTGQMMKPPQKQPQPTQQQPAPQPQLHGSLLVQLNDDEPTWYQYGGQLPGRNAIADADASRNASTSYTKSKQNAPKSFAETAQLVNKYRALGSGIYGREVQLSSKGSHKTADDRWVEATMHQGTLKDRIAAMSVLVSNDPVHKLYGLDGLLQLAGCHIVDSSNNQQQQQHHRHQSSSHSKPNSRVAQLAAQAMEDLFVNNLLPKDRKLVPLDKRPLHNYENSTGSDSGGGKSKSLSPRILLLWRLEEMVRDRYQAFVDQYLAKTMRDGMETDKKFCIRVASNLLKTVPEGEAKLLALIVNKLGDPSRTICSSASHALRQVLQQHPAMRIVIAREVQQLAHRPNLTARALYNCVNFLSQILLDRTAQGQELAGSLMATYFRLFDVIAGTTTNQNINSSANSKKKSQDDGEMLQSRLLSALLTGT